MAETQYTLQCIHEHLDNVTGKFAANSTSKLIILEPEDLRTEWQVFTQESMGLLV